MYRFSRRPSLPLTRKEAFLSKDKKQWRINCPPLLFEYRNHLHLCLNPFRVRSLLVDGPIVKAAPQAHLPLYYHPGRGSITGRKPGVKGRKPTLIS